MTLSAGQVSLGVSPDTRGFGAKLADGIMGEAGGFGGIGGKIAGLIAGGIAAVGIGEGLKKVFETGFDEAKDAAAGTAQLTAGIQSTGNAANVSVDGLNNLASSIQGYSGQTDDSIVKSEQLLLTFTNIKNNGPDKIFDQATKASADMAAKFGGDASSQAVLLGKALNDPVKGITALTRVGVSFTAQQKNTIDAMVKTGDVAGAQKVILGELNTEFGGAAKAAGESFPGELQRAHRAFEDLSQGIVQGFLPIFGPAIEGSIKLMQKITPAIGDASQSVANKMGIINGAFKGLYDLLVKGDFTSAFRKAFHVEEDSPIVGMLLKVHDALKEGEGGVRAFVAAFKAGGTDITSSGFAGALEGLGLKARALFDQIGPTLTGAFDRLKATLGPVIPQILGLAMALSPVHLIFTAIAPVLPQILSLVTSLASTLAGTLGAALVQLLPPLTQLAGTLATQLTSAVIAVLPIITELATVAAGVLTQALTFLVPILANVAQWLTQNAHLVIGAVAAYMGFKTVTSVMQAGKLMQEGYAAASYGTAAASYATGAAAKAGAIAYGLMNSTLVKGVAAWWANTAATLANTEGGLAAKAAILAGAAATGIATAAQWLWNIAMDANPIMLVVIGIGILVGAIIWVATQTTFFKDLWTGAITVIGAVMNWLWNSVISPVASWISGAFQNIGSAIGAVFGAIGGTVRDAFSGVVAFIRGVINSVIDIVNGAIGSINGIAGAVKDATGGAIDVHLNTIPHLATGGTIRTPGTALVGENGPEVVSLPAGATVYPTGTGPSSGGNTFNIYEAHNATATAQTVMQRITARKV